MAIPERNARTEAVRGISRTFFVSTKTVQNQPLFQSEKMALLMIDILRSYVAQDKFVLHDFVIMPDHIHLLLTVEQMMSVEKAVQLVKGGSRIERRRSWDIRTRYGREGFLK